MDPYELYPEQRRHTRLRTFIYLAIAVAALVSAIQADWQQLNALRALFILGLVTTCFFCAADFLSALGRDSDG